MAPRDYLGISSFCPLHENAIYRIHIHVSSIFFKSSPLPLGNKVKEVGQKGAWGPANIQKLLHVTESLEPLLDWPEQQAITPRMNRIRVHLSINAGDGEKETRKGKKLKWSIYTCTYIFKSTFLNINPMYAIVHTSRPSGIQSNFACSLVSYRGYKWMYALPCRDCVRIRTRLDAGMNWRTLPIHFYLLPVHFKLPWILFPGELIWLGKRINTCIWNLSYLVKPKDTTMLPI